MKDVYGGIEGGGTKFACVLGTGPDEIIDEIRFPTTTPAETLAATVEFFQQPRSGLTLRAVGVASFGPIDLDPQSETYGYITTTPKLAWQYTNVVGHLRQHLNVPVGWDTDVNGAALGEYRWGAGQGLSPVVYITVGTGIGGGALVNGEPLHGLLHPEMGHLPMPTPEGDTFAGVCPFHGRCLEGLACGPAIHARTGVAAEELAADDPAWEYEALYLAYGFFAITTVLSPQRIIVGGGVASKPGLLERVRAHLTRLNNGYVARPALAEQIDQYIMAPGLGNQSGTMGALELARRAYERA